MINILSRLYVYSGKHKSSMQYIQSESIREKDLDWQERSGHILGSCGYSVPARRVEKTALELMDESFTYLTAVLQRTCEFF